jgi:hypothetical protein
LSGPLTQLKELSYDPCLATAAKPATAFARSSRARGVIDAVTAATRRAPFQAHQLRQQPRVVEQVELARVDDGQQVAV